MKRLLFSICAFVTGVALVMSPAVSQPPEGKEGKGGGPEGKGGPPRFELGQVLPPHLIDELNLTPEQQTELEKIQKDLKTKLDKLLTEDQKKAIQNFRPRGPGGPMEKGGGEGGKGGAKGGSGGEGGKGGAKGGKGGGKGGEGDDRPAYDKKGG